MIKAATLASIATNAIINITMSIAVILITSLLYKGAARLPRLFQYFTHQFYYVVRIARWAASILSYIFHFVKFFRFGVDILLFLCYNNFISIGERQVSSSHVLSVFK